MRLWSLHPRYLDTVGLVACWHESLLAQKVLSPNPTPILTTEGTS